MKGLFSSLLGKAPSPAAGVAAVASTGIGRPPLTATALDLGVESTGPREPGPQRAAGASAIETPAPESPSAFSDGLRAIISAALRQIEASLDDKQRTGDAGAFLQELSGDPSGSIRQLPLAAQKGLGLISQDADNAKLTKHFERDPAITQALLQQANSVYYNPGGRRVLSVNEAINRLGRSAVKNVLLHQAVEGLVCRPGGEFDAMASKTWLHMVRTAQIARAIAPAFVAESEQAFALALLHDAGKLVVFDRISALRTRLRRPPSMERTIVSRALRLLHEPMGGLALLSWSLGLEAANTVATHHREPVPPVKDPLCEVLFTAERIDIARQKGLSFDADAAWRVGQLSGNVEECVRRSDAERGAQAA